MWARLIRDVAAPLAGIGIEVYQAVWAHPTSEMVIVAGLVMIGVPLDAALALLGRQLTSPPASPPESSPTTQSRPPL